MRNLRLLAQGNVKNQNWVDVENYHHITKQKFSSAQTLR